MAAILNQLINPFVISFYISFAGILGMIGFKLLEIRSGKRSWISKITDSTNHIVHDSYDRIREILSYINKKSAVALIQWIAYHILSWARNIYLWIREKAHAHPPSKKVIDMVRGKGEIKKNGGSSFYLKQISEKEDGEVKK